MSTTNKEIYKESNEDKEKKKQTNELNTKKKDEEITYLKNDLNNNLKIKESSELNGKIAINNDNYNGTNEHVIKHNEEMKN